MSSSPSITNIVAVPSPPPRQKYTRVKSVSSTDDIIVPSSSSTSSSPLQKSSPLAVSSKLSNSYLSTTIAGDQDNKEKEDPMSILDLVSSSFDDKPFADTTFSFSNTLSSKPSEEKLDFQTGGASLSRSGSNTSSLSRNYLNWIAGRSGGESSSIDPTSYPVPSIGDDENNRYPPASTGASTLVRTLSARNKNLEAKKGSSFSTLSRTSASTISRTNSEKKVTMTLERELAAKKLHMAEEAAHNNNDDNSSIEYPKNELNDDSSSTSGTLRSTGGSSWMGTLRQTLSRSDSTGENLTEEEKIIRKRFNDAVRALNWGMWKKGVDGMEALARQGYEPAIEFIDPARSEFKNPTGCFWLGKHFEEVAYDDGVALAWYAISAQGRYPPAMLVFAKHMAIGKGTDDSIPNPGLAMKYYQLAYSAPNNLPQTQAEAAERVGMLYLHGGKLSIDLSSSASPTPKVDASSLSTKENEANVDYMNMSDADASMLTSLPVHLPLATVWLRRAMKKGSTKAGEVLNSLSELSSHNAHAEAIELIKKRQYKAGISKLYELSENGHVEAVKDVDVTRSRIEGGEVAGWMGVWICKVAEVTKAQEDPEVVRDMELKAAAWFQKAALLGDCNSKVRLGAWWVEGHHAIGGQSDKAVAMAYYHAAWNSKGGKLAEAAEGMGMLLLAGNWSEASSSEIELMGGVKSEVNWTRFKDDPVSARGVRFHPDPKAAAQWLSKAWFRGSSKAEAALGVLLLYGDPENGFAPDVDQGMYHLNRAAKAGVPYAMRKYGEALLEGYGTRKDDTETGSHWIEMAKKAAMNGKEGVEYVYVVPEDGTAKDNENDDEKDVADTVLQSEDGTKASAAEEKAVGDSTEQVEIKVTLPTLGAPTKNDVPEGNNACSCTIL